MEKYIEVKLIGGKGNIIFDDCSTSEFLEELHNDTRKFIKSSYGKWYRKDRIESFGRIEIEKTEGPERHGDSVRVIQ